MKTFQRGEQNISWSFGVVGITGLILMFWGDPDIADAIIFHLMQGGG